MRPTVRRETRDATPTITASRLRGVSGLRCSGGVCANASLGKKTRKSTILLLLSASHVENKYEKTAYMVMKQTHCTPICTTPRSAAPQAVPEISRQHAISCWLAGRTRMFASAAIDEMVPSRTHHGERPAEVPCRMIFTCCGI